MSALIEFVKSCAIIIGKEAGVGPYFHLDPGITCLRKPHSLSEPGMNLGCCSLDSEQNQVFKRKEEGEKILAVIVGSNPGSLAQ